MIDLSGLPNGTPVWLTSTLVVISALLLFSEKAAKIKGPLGSFSRWWERRQADEIQRVQTTNDRIEAAAERRYGHRLKELEAAIKTIAADLDAERTARRQERSEMAQRYEVERDRIQQERDLFSAWAEHILSWWRGQAQWLATQGIKLPLPHLPAFGEFREGWMEVHYPEQVAKHN